MIHFNFLDGFENKDHEKSDAKELLTTNRALSMSIDSLEQRMKVMEFKNKKLKKYKKMVKCSTIFRCSKCSEFYLPHLFFDHIPSCCNYTNSNTSNNQPINHTNFSNSTHNNTTGSPSPNPIFSSKDTSNKDLNANFSSKISKQPQFDKFDEIRKYSNAEFSNFDRVKENSKTQENYIDISKFPLKLSIRQTNVQNGEDNKPFTEYTIFCSLKRVKWRITKKYSNFCQLHQELTLLFPNLALKNASYIISNVTNFATILDLKKPLLLEEKRKGLEKYLMEIAENEVLKNSEPFKRFLMIEEAIKKFSEPEKLENNYKFSTPVEKSKEKTKEGKGSFVSEKKSFDYSLVEKENNNGTQTSIGQKNEKIIISNNNFKDRSSSENSRRSSVIFFKNI